MASNANDLVIAIDSLMDELDQLADSPTTNSNLLFKRAKDTIEVVMGPESSSVFLMGPDDSPYGACDSGFEFEYYFPRSVPFLEQLQVAGDGILDVRHGKTTSIAVRIGTPEQFNGVLATKMDAVEFSSSTRSVLIAIGDLINRFVTAFSNRKGQSDDYLKRIGEFSAGCLSTLEIRELTKVIANDARVLFGCERVQVNEYRAQRLSLRAVSSVAVFEKRSDLLRASKRIATQVIKLKQPILSSQSQEQKQLQQLVDDYRELSGMPFFAFLPLQPRRPQDKRRKKKTHRPCGVLVIEYAENPNFLGFVQTANVVIPLVGLAISNAQAVAAIPFHKPLSFLGRALRFDSLARTLMWILIPLILLFVLFVIQTDFKIRMNGSLRAVDERLVFAPQDAFVADVLVTHGQSVTAGQLLVQLYSPDLQLELENAIGEIQKLTKFKAAKEIALNQASTGNSGDRSILAKLASEVADLQFQISTFEDNRDFANRRIEELKVYSPIAGKVVTWNVNKMLTQKPVRWGDPLMKVADEQSDWELRFKAAENKIGYIEGAANDSAAGLADLRVEYFFQSNPNQKFATHIKTAADSTEMDSEVGPSVAVNCDIDPEQALKRHGAKVVGDVVCGKRSLAFVWTYELVDAVRRQFVW